MVCAPSPPSKRFGIPSLRFGPCPRSNAVDCPAFRCVKTLIKPRLNDGILDTQRRLAEKSAELSSLREKYDQLGIILNTKLRQQADKFEAQMSLNRDAARPIRTYAQRFEDLGSGPIN